ncbi:MAG TPA: hypothetical protein VLH79_15845 [Chthonomonadales bacterium]|nr:hypothetical protein [Chthonomonadales bacterium]
MGQEPQSAGREFARRYRNILCGLQLQTGIHRRIETIVDEFAEEHPSLRATYIGREVDESYFVDGPLPVDALARPRLQGLAVARDTLHELIAFAHGLQRDTVELSSIVRVEETWLEPRPEEPFVLRIRLHHVFGACTVLLASTGEAQDAAREFAERVRYLRGW